MRLALPLACLALFALAGCSNSERSTDLGTGINTVDRDYQAKAPEAHEAAVAALERSGMRIVTNRCDSLGGEILAKRADESDVRVTTRSLDEDNCRMSIRVEPGDAALANILHERTACELGLCEATGGLFGGASEIDCYRMTVKEAMEAAKSSMSANKLDITHEEAHLTWCELEARQENSNPARIRILKGEDGCVDISFFAGTKKTKENQELAKKMHEAFDAKAQ